MKIRNLFSPLLLVFLTTVISIPGLAQKQQITDQVAKLQQAGKALNSQNDKSAIDIQIKDLEQDLAADRLLAALYKLQNSWLGVATSHYYEKQSTIVQDKLPLLDAEWKKAGQELSVKEKRFSPAVMNKLPSLAKAIIQASRHRSHPLYQSSILYGKNTNPNQGLYYIGNAQANIDLALFNQSLRFQNTKPSLKLISLEKELIKLEREIIESYRTSSPDDQNRYNALNATLKLAQELNERGWYEGALLKYLDAVMAFGMLKKIEFKAGEIPAIKQKIEQQINDLAKNKFDSSIGMSFLELAQSYLANSPDNENNFKRAKVILDEIIPKHHYYFSNLNTRGNK